MQQLIDKLEKTYITPQRKRSFLCCSECCDRARDSQALQQCIAQCEEPSQKTAQLVDGMLKDFQVRCHNVVQIFTIMQGRDKLLEAS